MLAVCSSHPGIFCFIHMKPKIVIIKRRRAGHTHRGVFTDAYTRDFAMTLTLLGTLSAKR